MDACVVYFTKLYVKIYCFHLILLIDMFLALSLVPFVYIYMYTGCMHKIS